MTTPMMQQYRDAKGQYPGMLVLFRNGDFYELFEDDAEIGARVLGITLTKRDKEIPMAGVPHHALDRYLGKLLQAGHRVAICEQMEEAADVKGRPIRREVVRVITPGTLTEDGLLQPRQSNHLAAVLSRGETVGLAWVELSTGEFQAADVATSRIADEIGRIAATECLVAEKTLYPRSLPFRGKSAAEGLVLPPEQAPSPPAPLIASLQTKFPSLSVTARPDWTFDPVTAKAKLAEHFGIRTFAGLGFDDDQACLIAAGALLLYVQETLKASLPHLSRLKPYRSDEYLLLDEVTRRSLELTRTLREGESAGSLLAMIDRTVTPMGARQLAEWITAPLCKLGAIEARLDAVGELAGDHTLRQDLRENLAEVYDLQRLTTRAATGRAMPRDLAGTARTLRRLPHIKAKITARRAALLNELESKLELCIDLREMLDAALVDDPPLTPREGGLIRPGFDAALDELHAITRDGKLWMAEFQAKEIVRTNISSLKVGYNQVFGYYIEITHTHAGKVPADYQRKQTLKNAERYITAELKAYEEKVLTAEDKIRQREYELFLDLRGRIAEQTTRLLQTAEVLAVLDVLMSLAELAVSRNYCRPTLCDESVLDITDGRHPVLDQTLPPGTFVPNDVRLGPEQGTFHLITGPNMSGKSTFIRQVALLTLLAQMGSFVPAKQARIGIADRIFTRVGASDELNRGQSTFMVEMTEAANILNNATSRSLVILDEIGRGTSTYDGVSLAWAITEYLHDRIGCRTLFATHYHELAQLAEKLSDLKNYNVEVREHEDQVIFMHKIGPGSADKSYGIHVAQLAGVPEEVLARAKEVLADLESHHVRTTEPTDRRRRRKPQPSLFAGSEDPVLQALREFDADKATPEDALTQIKSWRRDLR
jgi:DNA mismatch repair protein MutS